MFERDGSSCVSTPSLLRKSTPSKRAFLNTKGIIILVNQLVDKLEEGIGQLGLKSSPEDIARLLQFQSLLLKWNKVYNLTAIQSPEDMVGLHLLDSLSVLPYIDGVQILDVGTGAGLPGIPLALMCPNKSFSLLDSSSKKTRFVQQVALELDLRNVRVIHSRAEQYATDQPYDIVIARAFASLARIQELTCHLLGDTGKLLALKGRYSEQELDQMPPGSVDVIPLKIPGVNGERHLYCVARK